eukprot:8656507-Pyramimonas_sp.AAC.2
MGRVVPSPGRRGRPPPLWGGRARAARGSPTPAPAAPSGRRSWRGRPHRRARSMPRRRPLARCRRARAPPPPPAGSDPPPTAPPPRPNCPPAAPCSEV